eukprot:SAG11_NODE_2486_length_3303_cov_1.852060_2_plen_248_part_00
MVSAREPHNEWVWTEEERVAMRATTSPEDDAAAQRCQSSIATARGSPTNATPQPSLRPPAQGCNMVCAVGRTNVRNKRKLSSPEEIKVQYARLLRIKEQEGRSYEWLSGELLKMGRELQTEGAQWSVDRVKKMVANDAELRIALVHLSSATRSGLQRVSNIMSKMSTSASRAAHLSDGEATPRTRPKYIATNDQLLEQIVECAQHKWENEKWGEKVRFTSDTTTSPPPQYMGNKCMRGGAIKSLMIG